MPLCISQILVAVVVFLQGCAAETTVRSLEIKTDIRFRFATTLVTSTVVNDDRISQEAMFEVVLPEEAFISNFSMTVDGHVYVGNVKEKAQALKTYQEAKQSGQSAGYIKTTSRHSNKFDIAINLKARSQVTFNLTYQQLLKRVLGVYEHKVNVNPGRVVRTLKVEVFIQESRAISTLQTPGVINDLVTDQQLTDSKDVSVITISPNSRYILYNPSEKQQAAASAAGVRGQFMVQYDVERMPSAGEVLVVDGYFLHFFTPENAGTMDAVPKDIVFVLDVSGSMTGSRLAQLKEAMITILKELDPADNFAIVEFNDRKSWWRSRFVEASKENVEEAIQHVRGFHADDSTDINGALLDAVRFQNTHRNREHVPLIFFLTDGEPTSGERDPQNIANAVKRDNEGVSSVYGLAFGEGADYNLVKVIATQNQGFARRIYEAADSSLQVNSLYDEISTTLLRNLTIKYLNDTVLENTVTTTFYGKVFKGQDIVIAGQLTPHHHNVINAVVTAEGKEKVVKMHLDNNSNNIILEPDVIPNTFFHMPVDFSAVIKRSWAYLKIKDLLRQKKAKTYVGGTDDLDKQIKAIALQYNFVTPLTSMVATKPEEKKPVVARIDGDDYGTRKQNSGGPFQLQSSFQQTGFQQSSFPHSRVYLKRKSSSLPKRMMHSPISHNSQPEAAFPGMAGLPMQQPPPMMPMRAMRPMRPMPTRAPPRISRKHSSRRRLSPGGSGLSRGKRIRKKNKKGKKRQRKGRKPSSCVNALSLLAGFGVSGVGKRKCTWLPRRIRPGNYRIFPYQRTKTVPALSVQATFGKDNRTSKIMLQGLSIMHLENNRTTIVHIRTDQSHNGNDTWSTQFSGHNITVSRKLECGRRRQFAKYFVQIDAQAQAQPTRAIGTRMIRDVKKMSSKAARRKMYRGNSGDQMWLEQACSASIQAFEKGRLGHRQRVSPMDPNGRAHATKHEENYSL